MASTFDGFPKGGQEFFLALTMNMEREWFNQHKGDYQRLWHEPMEAYLGAVQTGVQRAFPQAKGQDVKVMRIYRDVRFSKDKTPYKTTVSGVVPLYKGTEVMRSTGLYSEFGAEPFVAMGRWMMEPPQLSRFRKRVADEKTGAPFAAAVAKLVAKGYQVSSMGALKRMPKGFDPQHPRGELLKLKGFAFAFPPVPEKLLGTAKLVPWVVEHALELRAPIEWMEAAVRGGPLPKI